jgi:hypothetical protein
LEISYTDKHAILEPKKKTNQPHQYSIVDTDHVINTFIILTFSKALVSISCSLDPCEVTTEITWYDDDSTPSIPNNGTTRLSLTCSPMEHDATASRVAIQNKKRWTRLGTSAKSRNAYWNKECDNWPELRFLLHYQCC